jgi:hypothetical protein
MYLVQAKQALRLSLEDEAAGFNENRHMKVERSASRTGHLYTSFPKEVYPVIISVRGRVEPKATV